MSPAKKDENGKWKVDWTALIILGITIVVSAGATSVGSYYALVNHFAQHELRLKVVEDWRTTTEKQFNEHIAGYSGDKVNDQWMNECVKEMKRDISDLKSLMNDVRKDQIRRYNQGFGGK